MQGTMNLTDIARYMGVSRPTAYKIVRSVGFPLKLEAAGAPRWSAEAVQAWTMENASPEPGGGFVDIRIILPRAVSQA